jgi:hypothetical protein
MLWHGLHPLKAKDYAVGDTTQATNKAAAIKLLAWSYTQKTSNNDVFYSPKVPYELVCHQPTSRYPYPNNIKLVFFLIVLHLSLPLVCIFAKAISDCKRYVKYGQQVVNWSVFLHFPFVC